jgi:hypothetical protein
MRSTFRRLFVSAFLLAAAALAAPAAFAQGGATAPLTGTVVDTSGAVVPGASVVVKNVATSGESEAVTNAEGQFTVPALSAGKYSVTVSLSGFKTVTVNDVEMNAGVPGNVKVTMAVGGIEEQVVVTGGTEVVATQSSAVSSTMTIKQIQSLPLTSRNALSFVANLAGVNTPGTVRDSTINGLPQGAINITLDGISIQDNYLKTTDGFFARVQPRLDAIEEVTVTTAANGADSAGQGAVNIKFTTRSGSNTFKGSVFHTYRNDALNANSFFNNRNLAPDPKTGKAPKADLVLNQPGFNAGGPIMIPGLFDGHDKAFFFFNYEDSREPSNIRRDRVIFNPDAMQGVFSYSAGGSVRSVNLFDLARNAGLGGSNLSVDPVIARLFADIRSASGQGQITNLADPLLQQASFQLPTNGFTPFPTGRIDYNISKNHRLTGSFNYNHINSRPDTTNTREPFFPGFPNTGSQQSTRYTTSESLRSTFGATLVNELRIGASGGATYFSPELSPALFGGTSVADQGGFYLNYANGWSGTAPTNAGGNGNFSAREASTKVVEDTLNWVKGTHNTSYGFSMTQGDLWLKQQQVVPEIRFGIATGDPAAALFNTTNFPNASNANLTNARQLYSILTGRVTSILGTARLNADTNVYEYNGLGKQQGRMRQFGFFAQDNWRVRSNLTVNAGLRYELQMPFYPLNNSYSTATVADVCGISGQNSDGTCRLFDPTANSGKVPQFVNYAKNTRAFNIDKNNFAPSLGLTWRPNQQDGLFRRILGEEGDTVFFGSYAMSYERPGMGDYSGVLEDNPGISLSANRDQTTNTLGAVPLFFRDTARLTPGPFSATPQYPITEVITGDIHIFSPDLQTPYAQTWAGGLRRKITRDVGVEVRYVGTRHLQGWGTFNMNEANIIENGFLDEFRLAQANLQANNASGIATRANSFAYFGPGTGTSPLPIYLAYLNGVNRAQAGNAALYTGSAWSDTNFTNPLAIFNPNPFTPAGTNANTGLDGSATRRSNAVAAGLARNFFRANPDLLGGANIEANTGYTKYDGLQFDVTKRLSHGFLVQANYAYGKAYTSSRYSLRVGRLKTQQTGAGGDNPASPVHAFKANWVFELPFGDGRKFLSDRGALISRLVGGWELDGVLRTQSGRLLDFGNVRVIGMSIKEFQKAYGQYEYATTGLNPNAPVNIYNLPQDILENTVRAFSTSATSATGYGALGRPTGRYLAPASGPDCIEKISNDYGECGVRTLVVTGPRYMRLDLSAVKRTRLIGRTALEFRADMINALNHPNFTPVQSTSSTVDNYRVTGVMEDTSRGIQLVTRFSW